MASFNKIIIVGYLGRDPELQYTPQGTGVCKFTVATTEKWKDRAGEPSEATTWFRVSAWGKLGEIANQYLAKGKQVYVEGRLRQTEYTDRDGNRRQSLEVTATDLHFIGPRGDEMPGPARPAAAAAGGPEPMPTAHEDDIPF